MDSKVKDLVYLIEKLTDKVSLVFETPKDNAFIVATTILSQKELPLFKNISDEDNSSIQSYFRRYKAETYTVQEIRKAFNEAFLFSLRDKENYEIETSSELIILYLRMITLTIKDCLDYEHTIILNPSSNNGSLVTSICQSENVNSSDVYVTEDRYNYASITMNLRDMCNLDYKISDTLPSMRFRCDIIVSDPFLRSVEDILIFFEDYHEYLNQDGFIIVSLMTDFVRSRVFSDMIEKYGYMLIGLVEYPKDLYNGLIKNSIVILENKKEKNDEFFTTEMPSVKNIDDNFKVLNDIKLYLTNYLGGSKNENNVN